MEQTKKAARIAGFLYLTYIITMIVAQAVFLSPLIIFGDSTATANNIITSEWQFRIGFVCDLLSGLLFLLTAWALYVLLKPVDKNIALLFMLLNLGGVAVECINRLNLVAALLLSSGADTLKVFQADQLHALAMFFLNLHTNGFMIAQLFYGAWLFPLGYLVFKSGFLPKFLGILLMIHCFGWLMYFFQTFLFPGYEVIKYLSFPLGFIAEVSLGLWLFIKGVKNPKLTLGKAN